MRRTNKHSTGNRLDPIDKITVKALLSSNKTAYQVSKQTGISHQTVMKIKRDDTILPQIELDTIKKGLAGKLYQKANEAVYNITQDKLDNASALQLMTIAGIGIDKARLMSDQSNFNVSIVGTYNQISESFDRFSKQFNDKLTSDNNSYESKPSDSQTEKVDEAGVGEGK